SAIHTSMPLRDGSIRTAATACAARALASIEPCGRRTMTSSPSEAISARILFMKGSAEESAKSRTTPGESEPFRVCASRRVDDSPLPTTAASTSQCLLLDDELVRLFALPFTWREYL